MKLRYYLRGLGVGILVTAIIMGVASWGRQETLSDAQIRERALKMGMVDGSSAVLSDLQSGTNPAGSTKPASPIISEDDASSAKDPADPANPTKESTAPTSSAKDPADPANPTKESAAPTSSAKDPADPANPTKESTAPASSAKDPASPANPTKESTAPTSSAKNPAISSNSSQSTVTIVIKGGSGSETVSRTLAEAGLVPDAKAYDQYLCDNGYSKGLRAGTYEIPEGASEEEIANIIATKR